LEYSWKNSSFPCHVSSLKMGASFNKVGRRGVSFQRAAPKFVHLSDHAPWVLKLVSFKGKKSERPWDGSFLGLSMEEKPGCRADEL
jgi:hypothetical protein